jgi:hypothetical protein
MHGVSSGWFIGSFALNGRQTLAPGQPLHQMLRTGKKNGRKPHGLRPTAKLLDSAPQACG